MTVKMVESLPNEELEKLFYIGPYLRKDGWYKLYSDGKKNYTLIKRENQD